MSNQILLYTDGAARGNPGPGGYGVVLMYGKHQKEISGGFRLTTNNRMEIVAVIEGLKSITNKEIPVAIYSDSQYVVKAINEGWLNKWINTNFKGDKKNPDLWREIYLLLKQIKATFHWVKGHASNVYNNRCDELATAAADDKSNLKIDDWYEQNKS